MHTQDAQHIAHQALVCHTVSHSTTYLNLENSIIYKHLFVAPNICWILLFIYPLAYSSNRDIILNCANKLSSCLWNQSADVWFNDYKVAALSRNGIQCEL